METTFKERLATERIELNERITKLESFINTPEKFHKALAQVHQSLLNIQFSAMKTYSQCLLERLEWLNDTKE